MCGGGTGNLSSVNISSYDPKVREQLQLVDPKGVLCAGRLDIVVRYYLFRDLYYGKISDIHKSLYCRTILSRTGAIEPVGTWSPEKKEGIEKHIDSAIQLFNSMKTNGFQMDGYVPIGEDKGLFNGAHRIACAIALNQEIWVRYVGQSGIKNLDFGYFENAGFSTDDKIRILRGYADIHKNCGIFVMYGPAISRWEYMIKEIEKELTIVGTVDLDFSNDFVGYRNLIYDIYDSYEENSLISAKVDLLMYAELKLRVVLVSDEGLVIQDDENFYSSIIETKAKIRNELQYDFNKEAFVTLHASDSEAEFNSLKQILLSVNNLRCIHMRQNNVVREEFGEWIENYKKWMHNNNFNTDDACIVGSSPLEVLGIRNSTDIDIVISPEMRQIFGDGITHVTSDLDIATRNYVRRDEEVYIADEQLIYDDECHFMFMGVKFANPELVLIRKSSSEREKDIRDVKLLNTFFEYSRYFDNKRVLQEQINKELIRRGLDNQNVIKRTANKIRRLLK